MVTHTLLISNQWNVEGDTGRPFQRTRVRFPNGIWLSDVFAAVPFEGLAMVP
jgi:hypothetical protein